MKKFTLPSHLATRSVSPAFPDSRTVKFLPTNALSLNLVYFKVTSTHLPNLLQVSSSTSFLASRIVNRKRNTRRNVETNSGGVSIQNSIRSYRFLRETLSLETVCQWLYRTLAQNGIIAWRLVQAICKLTLSLVPEERQREKTKFE